jgi:hypothetical protein
MDLQLIKAYVENSIDITSKPLYNSLEVGFRHHPLSDKEKLERYKESFEIVDQYLMALWKELNKDETIPNTNT